MRAATAHLRRLWWTQSLKFSNHITEIVTKAAGLSIEIANVLNGVGEVVRP
jgi:hypothetical protein